MMNYQHRFTVKAPLAAVRQFHRQAASMGAITPPPVIVRVHQAPAVLEQGDQMDFTMWLGPLPVHWVARIEEVTEISFVDRMIEGPFSSWAHRHSFVAVNEQMTEIHDQVEATLSPQPFWQLVGRIMWLNLPVLFAYRAFRTRQLLKNVH